ncbi:MAG: AmmeMemoRadiSam system protein A [Bacteroidota bacterium]
MPEDRLTAEEQHTLLALAREALEGSVLGKPWFPLALSGYPPRLREEGASFVTLTIGGQLRGCIGALQAYQPLAEDVREHAISAGLEDPRFPPVRVDELSQIQIEVSRLSRPVPLEYETPEALPGRLRPHLDGVILSDGLHRATFLPQVWEKIPDPVEFLENLCYKMGAGPDLWRRKHLDVQIYEVQEFHE